MNILFVHQNFPGQHLHLAARRTIVQRYDLRTVCLQRCLELVRSLARTMDRSST